MRRSVAVLSTLGVLVVLTATPAHAAAPTITSFDPTEGRPAKTE